MILQVQKRRLNNWNQTRQSLQSGRSIMLLGQRHCEIQNLDWMKYKNSILSIFYATKRIKIDLNSLDL